MTFRSRKLLDLAEGQSCVRCHAQDGTVVAAHSDSQWYGKGIGHKSSDAAIMFFCYRCHEYKHSGGMKAEEGPDYEHRYIAMTLVRLIEQGKLVVK